MITVTMRQPHRNPGQLKIEMLTANKNQKKERHESKPAAEVAYFWKRTMLDFKATGQWLV